MRKAASFLVVLAVVTAGAYVYAQRFSRLNSWELTFASKPLRVLEVRERTGINPYTYILYEITNNTDSAVDFYPGFEIETADGEVTTASVKPVIFSKIVADSVGEILSFQDMAGVIEPGETKKGVAIFEGVDPAADVLAAYVTGLTGDFVTRATEEGAVRVLYRTYKMIYRRPGDEYHAQLDPVKLLSSEWVWR